MKKQLLTFTSLLCASLVPFISNGQEVYKHCGTQEIHNEYVKTHPEVLEVERQAAEFEKKYARTMDHLRMPGQVYIIPMVFHILHQYGPENISDAQIHDAVDILNRDYRALNPDSVDIVPQFQSIFSDTEIEFRLATIDPNGNCTNGIERIYTYETNVGDNGSKINQWDRSKYLNVWLVSNISSGAAGYSQYPSAVLGPNYVNDGVMILSDYVGSIGTGSVNTSRALTHEIGHYLNLAHVWGSTNQPGVACGDDGVLDTPETKGWSSCVLNGSICNPPVIENVQNYMEYSYCSNMFTDGQAVKMRAALNNPIWTFRSNLWSAANLAATGVLVTPAPTCVPVAAFDASTKYVCEGGSVTFQDGSYGGATSWSWSFPGGNPSTSTLQNPTIQYNVLGNYDVTLTATNAAGNNTVIHVGNVVVSYPVPVPHVPYSESFESITVPGNDWYINDKDGGNSWTRTGAAAKTGSYSMTKNNFQGNAIGVDEFITPAIDLKWVTGASATFELAFAYRTNTGTVGDQLRVLSSNDCGKTWTPRYLKNGLTLSTAGIVGTSFIPNASQWSQKTVPLTNGQVSGQGNVRLKFEYTYDQGNNIYIDDININGTVGIDEAQTHSLNLSVSPNPAKPSTVAPVVSFTLTNEQRISILVTDALGRVIDRVDEKTMEAGDHQYQLWADLKPGVYFIQLYLGESLITKKLVIQ
jgi:PKD repeat protein